MKEIVNFSCFIFIPSNTSQSHLSLKKVSTWRHRSMIQMKTWGHTECISHAIEATGNFNVKTLSHATCIFVLFIWNSPKREQNFFYFKIFFHLFINWLICLSVFVFILLLLLTSGIEIRETNSQKCISFSRLVNSGSQCSYAETDKIWSRN